MGLERYVRKREQPGKPGRYEKGDERAGTVQHPIILYKRCSDKSAKQRPSRLAEIYTTTLADTTIELHYSHLVLKVLLHF